MLKRVRIDGDILHCVSRKEAKAVAAQIEKYFRNGITDDHLSAVRQIVMEVHDIDGRKKKIGERLRATGFGHIISEKDRAVPAVEDIFMLYAGKKK